MDPFAGLVVLGHAVGAAGLGWLYFRRYALARPPIGVFNLEAVGLYGLRNSAEQSFEQVKHELGWADIIVAISESAENIAYPNG
jgi:hypothetical protein